MKRILPLCIFHCCRYTTTVLTNVFVQGCFRAVRFAGAPNAAGELASVTIPHGTAAAGTFVRIIESVVGIRSDPSEMGKHYQGETLCPVKNKSRTYEASLYLPKKQSIGSRIFQVEAATQVRAPDNTFFMREK